MGVLREDLCAYIIASGYILLRMRNILENIKHILYSTIFS
jgi:hypothetical protein